MFFCSGNTSNPGHSLGFNVTFNTILELVFFPLPRHVLLRFLKKIPSWQAFTKWVHCQLHCWGGGRPLSLQVECLEAKTREKKTHHHQTTGSGLALPPLIKLEIHHCGNKGEIVSRKDTDIAAEAAPAAWAHLAEIMTATNLLTPGKDKTTGADLVGICPYNVWGGMQRYQSPREDTMEKSERSPHQKTHRYIWEGRAKPAHILVPGCPLKSLLSSDIEAPPGLLPHGWWTTAQRQDTAVSTDLRGWMGMEGVSCPPTTQRWEEKRRFYPASMWEDTWQLLEYPHIFWLRDRAVWCCLDWVGLASSPSPINCKQCPRSSANNSLWR